MIKQSRIATYCVCMELNPAVLNEIQRFHWFRK